MCDSQPQNVMGQVIWIPTLEAPSTAISEAPEMAPKLVAPEATEVAPEMCVDAAPEKGTRGREELTSSSH